MSATPTRTRVWEENISVPTYERGAEDKYPPLLMKRRNPIHPGGSIIYPYPLQETLSNRKHDRQWRALCLENDYLRLVVLPDLGGRLLQVFDKVAASEAIYHNQVIKWARIGIRGAWVSGGIEWNFPNGHTVTSSSPIDCTARENTDGSASLVFGDTERISRMRWWVVLTLYPDRAYFETEIHLNNRTSFPNRFWFWANSSAPVSAGMEYLSSATRVMTLKDVMDFPVHDGVDIHWDRNHVEAQDMFCLNPRLEYVGWYNHDLGRGMVNVADRTEARGTKFFTWGNSDDGAIWEGRLTDADGPYAEMQSGRLPTMGIWEILSPYSEESWKELWYPVRNTGAPSFANRHVAFCLEPTEQSGRIRLGLQATGAYPKARLELVVDNKKVWATTSDLDPVTALVEEIALEGVSFPGREAVLTVHSATGELLARAVRRGKNEPALEYKGYVKVKTDRQGPRAENQWLNGIGFEKLGDYEKAREAYSQALEDDPGHAPARVALAVLCLRRGLLEEAAEGLRAALDREPGCEDARFYLGLCALLNEDFAGAIEELKYLLRSRPYRGGAAYLLGGLYLGQGELARACEQLEKCRREFPWNREAAALLACALRHQGKLDEARGHLEVLSAQDPLGPLSSSEAFFLTEVSGIGAEPARLRLEAVLRDEVQSYLELAWAYAGFGLYEEAREILSLYNDGVPAAHRAFPLVDYCLGYFTEKLGSSEAGGHYKAGAGREPDFVFPHRLEEERVLRRVIEVSRADAPVRYYLGNLLCSRGRHQEALRLWEEAAPRMKGFSVVHRNIGRVCWKALADPDRAIQAYERALAADPEGYKLYFELNRILSACGLEERRRALLERIPDKLMENDVVAELVAAQRVDTGQFDQALEILAKGYFYPWEVYKGVRILYVDAHVGNGVTLMAQGRFREAVGSFEKVFEYPRNIGVGEPFFKANAEAHYRIGVAWETAGDSRRAGESWRQAAEERRPHPGALSYYQARAWQRLGSQDEATRVLEQLLSFVRENPGDNDIAQAECNYLSGLANKGMGKEVQALREFTTALGLNRSHRRCRWLVSGLLEE